MLRQGWVAAAAACLAQIGLTQQGDPNAPTDATRLRIEKGRLELTATWEPFRDSVYGFGKRFALVRELAPAKRKQTFDAVDFRRLLPPRAVRVGDVWKVEVAHVLPFLKQLHRGATGQLHHGGGQAGITAPGAWACLRALSETHAEIVLRVHADFLIDGDGTRGRSSWLTPAQFRGRLRIDRRERRAIAFELALPDQSANVDLNIKQARGYIADIGRIPRMEVRSRSLRDDVPFDRQITLAEARQKLRRQFYPFARVEWLELEAAWKRVKATGKPLHVIALFGSLTDESC